MFRLLFTSVLLMSAPAFATLQKQAVPYSAGADKMEGFLVYDDAVTKPKGAILIVPDWMGLGDYAKGRAEQLAKMGYVALAVDVYGKGKNPKNSEEAAALAGKYKGDRNLLRSHIRAAYDKLLTEKNVDPKKMIAIGYCFGGTTALELARSGAPLAGTAVFHAGLNTPTPADAKNIKGPVLAMHGADDPYVPAAEVAAFKKEMKDGHVKLTFVAYPGAVHSFTIPDAGSDNSKGAAYNAEADKKSWVEFTKFLKKI
jgi:dienelactone hydrolase